MLIRQFVRKWPISSSRRTVKPLKVTTLLEERPVTRRRSLKSTPTSCPKHGAPRVCSVWLWKRESKKKSGYPKPRSNFSTEYCEAFHRLMIGKREKWARTSRKQNVRLGDVLKKASIKTTDVSNVTPISPLADGYRRFGWTCSLNLYTENRKHKSLPNAGTNLQKYTLSHPTMVILKKAELHLFTQQSERVCDNLVF